MKDLVLDLIIPRYHNNFYPKLLRKGVLSVITVAVLGVNLVSSGFGGGIFAGSISSAALVSLTNQERVAAGINSLGVDSRLVAAAHAKAQHIFEYQYWSHYGPNGETPWQFISSAGYAYVYAGENLAKGFSSSEAVHAAWMASQTHRDNIMNSHYADVGIAVVTGTLEGTEVVLVVQMFGSLSQASTTPVAQTAEPGTASAPIVNTPDQVVIEIEYPQSEARLADSELEMRGAFAGSVTGIDVYDNGQESEGDISGEGVWTYKPEETWEEGKHDVVVWDSDNRASAAVDFEIDTTPPAIDTTNLTIEKADEDGSVVEIGVYVDESAVDVVFVADEFSISLSREEGTGMYQGIITSDEFDGDNAKILAVDDLGNTSELDVTEEVLGELTINEDSGSGTVVLGTSGIAKGITRAAVILIALLLALDVYYLFKLNIIHTRGKTIFPMALWIIVMAVGLILGPGGTIL